MKRSFPFLVLISLFMAACTSLQQKAQSQFEAGEYQLAINSFSKILEENPDDQKANLIVAESYRLSNRLEKAAPYYDKVLEKEASFDNYYKKGKSLKDQGNYEEAIKAYTASKEHTQNDSLVDLADKAIADIRAMESITDYWPHHVLENYTLLNTPGIDYAPVVSEGFIYFTSSRGGGGIYPATGQGYTRLYRARAEGVKVDVQNVQEMPEFPNEQGLNQGTIAISPDGNTIVYARGNSTSKKDLPDVSLFASYFRGAAFTEPIFLPLNEDPNFWNSTPTFSPDGETLYFASNRPGGYGGTDLYKATRVANGDFGNVQNLGPEINTAGNEMFPMPVASGEFFFASDGHPGFGKLDLFVAENNEGKLEIKNLGKNINSIADDFGIFFTDYPKEGFITSNREGGVGDDDIYYFQDQTPKPKIVNVFLNVTTKERKEGGGEEILPQTRVALYDETNKSIDGDFTNPKGQVRFKLEVDKDFSIIASKNGYFTQSINYTTKGKTPAPETLVQDITNVTLDTTIVLEQLVLEKAIVLENIYYDLDKADIRPDAAEELDKLVKILKDNPNIRIELSSHTDDRASDAYNLDLSQRRAESAVEYLVSQGIERDRMVARGYGESQLIIPNATTEEEHQRNRRTEFKVIEVEE
jgi:peptidoglycan-associated lipoprotein